MKPLILESKLTKPSRWYVATKYVEKKGVDVTTGEDTFYIKALVKHDVTDQMEAILKRRASKPRLSARRTGRDG